MSAIITPPKVHHFIPLNFPQVQNIKSPSYGAPEALGEYRRTQLNAGATSFTFPADHYPLRVDDILLENLSDRRIMPNRQAPMQGPGKSVIFGRELFEYDLATRTITFHRPLGIPVQMHWFNMGKARSWNDQWITVSVKSLLIQGSNYIDETLIPPNETELTGKYQGSCRCFPELVSQTKQGIVRLNDTLDGFAYRGRVGFSGADSFEFLIYNSWGQVSDVCCYTFQCS